MNNKNFANQRDTYKLVEELTSGKFRNELLMLKSLVRHIVNHEDFEIFGGRIWELDAAANQYNLRYQTGKVKKIPSEYTIKIDQEPSLAQLAKERILLNYESNEYLRAKGIEIYSVAGVGDIVRTKSGKFYKYALSFNAPQILQTFYETLSIISSVATVSLRNISDKEHQEKMQQDIFKASEIQRSLLPEHYVEFLDYKVFGVCIPDSAVGGDYFDYLKSPNEEDDRLGIVITDAASKGLPAAVQALFVSGAIRMGKGFSTRIAHLIGRLNSLIFKTFPYERFVTLFYCELTRASNRLVLYANAGHCAPIHYRPSTDEHFFLNATGGLLGLMEEQKFGVENIAMREGDIVALFTDGISEARNKDGKFFGEENILRLLKKYSSEPADKLCYRIIEEVQKFSANSTYTDDKTLIIIKRD